MTKIRCSLLSMCLMVVLVLNDASAIKYDKEDGSNLSIREDSDHSNEAGKLVNFYSYSKWQNAIYS